LKLFERRKTHQALGIEKVAKGVANQQSSVSCQILVEIVKQDAISSVSCGILFICIDFAANAALSRIFLGQAM
jgi:hypothetical protein